ncbi:hypothetical protein LSTR_LSTR004658 [Laodelphax striatellus]|uniref:Orange domain-containing protein n=1 Tax=Laodelphax striatellus TaxID=195883 RepID=A0A482WVB2_LAOST|nr:hypothetical protein LSTR_LSTR004658 [Laodelphax striatellus]
MQDRTTQCLVEKPINGSSELSSVQQSSGEALPVDVYEMAELVAGYMDCMQEAIRYLTEEEMYPETHPAVQGLRSHLASYRSQMLKEALQTGPR